MDCTNVRYSKENHVDKCKATSNHGIRNTRGTIILCQLDVSQSYREPYLIDVI